jgi:hypothetical protein
VVQADDPAWQAEPNSCTMAAMQLRRRTDSRLNTERRGTVGDRRIAPPPPATIRFPSRQEQAIQFLTRYLFAILGVVFFNYSESSSQVADAAADQCRIRPYL